MCMLTFFPEGIMPDIQALRNGTYCNDDGHGFAIVVPEQKKLIVSKSMDSEYLLEQFQEIRTKYPEGPALFHSRFTTHGLTNVDNCHPFHVGNDNRTVIGHNGILPHSSQPLKGDDRSDTRKFAETLYQTGGYGSIRTKAGQRRLADYIGTYNKLVFLTVNPRYSDNSYIINEEAGIWEKGIWYSNEGYVGYITQSHIYVPKRSKTEQCPSCFTWGALDPWTEICSFCHMCAGCIEYASECKCYSPQKMDQVCYCINNYVCQTHKKDPTAVVEKWQSKYNQANSDNEDDWCPCTTGWKCRKHRKTDTGFTFGKTDNEILSDKAQEQYGKNVEDMTEIEWQNFLDGLKTANEDKTDTRSFPEKVLDFRNKMSKALVLAKKDNSCWCDNPRCAGNKPGITHIQAKMYEDVETDSLDICGYCGEVGHIYCNPAESINLDICGQCDKDVDGCTCSNPENSDNVVEDPTTGLPAKVTFSNKE